jgi:hypothetical protein
MFLKKNRGQSMVEWIVGAAIIVAILGGVILTLHSSLAQKLQEYIDAL